MDLITNYDEYMQRQPRLQPRVRCIEMEHPSWVSPIRICIDDVNGLDFGDKRFDFAQVLEREKVVKTSLDYGFDVGIGGYNIELYDIIKTTDFNLQGWIDYTHYDFNAADTSKPMRVIKVEVTAIQLKKSSKGNVANFEALPPMTATNKTGTTYNYADVPMLEAFA